MANQFLISVKRHIALHGEVVTYSSITDGVYNVETGSVTNTNTDILLPVYKKHIKANQYNYPNLIGKDAAVFYLANDQLSFVPKIRDKIVTTLGTYTVDSISEHRAEGLLVLFKILAVKG